VGSQALAQAFAESGWQIEGTLEGAAVRD